MEMKGRSAAKKESWIASVCVEIVTKRADEFCLYVVTREDRLVTMK